MKKPLLLISTENVLSVPGPLKQPLLGFPDTLGCIFLMMHKWIKTQLKLRWPGAELLSVVPGEELGRVALAGGSTCCLYNPRGKTNAGCYFCFSPFLWKQKSSLDFFRLAKTGTDVGLFLKAKWCNMNFQTAEDTLLTNLGGSAIIISISQILKQKHRKLRNLHCSPKQWIVEPQVIKERML